jgi:hypothetical protein
MGELFGDHQQASNEFVITRYNNNNKPSLKSFKKPSKPRQAKQLVIVSFNLKLRGVLSGRRVGRRPESGRLKRKPKESIVEASATLPKLYNCPNRVSAKLQNLISQLQSVKSVVVLLQLWWEPQGVHQLFYRVVAVIA